jgi:hypothetical protein
MRKLTKITWKPEGGWGKTIVHWDPHGFLAEHAHLLQQLLVLSGELRPLPSRDLAFLRARGTVLALFGVWSHGGSMVEKQRGSRGCMREVLEEEEGHRERDDVQRIKGGKVRTRVQLIGARQYAQPSDEKGRILNPTRVQVVE